MAENSQRSQLTLSHLLTAMSLVMPVVAVVGGVKHAGGGVRRYLFGVLFGFILGACLVLFDWHIGKFFWFRAQLYSERAREITAMGFFALQLVFIVVGGLAGDRLAQLLIRYSP